MRPPISNTSATYTPVDQDKVVRLLAPHTYIHSFIASPINHRLSLARNMQMANWNKEYAASISEIKEDYEPIKNDDEEVLNLLLTNDDYDFGSAAWYLTIICSGTIIEGLQEDNDAGWEAYITECVGTTVTEERKDYLERARDAMDEL